MDELLNGASVDDAKMAQATLADAAWQSVTDEYLRLEAAIRDPSKRSGYQQPWLHSRAARS